MSLFLAPSRALLHLIKGLLAYPRGLVGRASISGVSLRSLLLPYPPVVVNRYSNGSPGRRLVPRGVGCDAARSSSSGRSAASHDHAGSHHQRPADQGITTSRLARVDWRWCELSYVSSRLRHSVLRRMWEA